MEFPILLTIIRLVVPILILRFPLAGILLSITVDMYDWKFIELSHPEADSFYQNWDKILDLYYQLFIFFIVLRFNDIVAKKTAIILFLYRLLGLVIFYITNNRQVLLFFPNVLENFVVLYLLFIFLSKQSILFKTKRTLISVLAVLAIPKIIHEYFQHFLVKQPWEIYDIGAIVGTSGIIKEYVNYLSWGALLYVVPIGITLYILVVKHTTRRQEQINSF